MPRRILGILCQSTLVYTGPATEFLKIFVKDWQMNNVTFTLLLFKWHNKYVQVQAKYAKQIYEEVEIIANSLPFIVLSHLQFS